MLPRRSSFVTPPDFLASFFGLAAKERRHVHANGSLVFLLEFSAVILLALHAAAACTRPAYRDKKKDTWTAAAMNAIMSTKRTREERNHRERER